MEKYMSVITNFGCHYKCPYCVVKKNNLHIPKTTINGLNNLEKSLSDTNCTVISVSGGGDPLHEYNQHRDWYRRLFEIVKGFHVEIDGKRDLFLLKCIQAI